jgi:hypothetical protein
MHVVDPPKRFCLGLFTENGTSRMSECERRVIGSFKEWRMRESTVDTRDDGDDCVLCEMNEQRNYPKKLEVT